MTQDEAVLYRPALGAVGDVIPFVHEDEVWLFYLWDRRDGAGGGTPWRLVRTKNMLEFEDVGVVLAAGTPDDPDFNCYTGSIVRDNDRLVLFYTAHNPNILGTAGRDARQSVMRAFSDGNPTEWTRDSDFLLEASDGYVDTDWRDPFVFWDNEKQCWTMLLASRLDDATMTRRRGVVAALTSTDLDEWQIAAPFFSPHQYLTHECPDYFIWNNRSYLIYSEFTDRFSTRYHYADENLKWRTPLDNSISNRSFYAAKSFEWDNRRFLAGWIPSKANDNDDGDWEWGGTLAVLEALQNSDGRLSIRLLPELLAQFPVRVPNDFDNRPIAHTSLGHRVSVTHPSEDLHSFRASFDVTLGEGSQDAGLLFGSEIDGDCGHFVRLEPARHRVVLDRWPRRRTGNHQWQVSGDVPYDVGAEQAVNLPAGTHHVDVVVDGSAVLVNVNEAVVLTGRAYSRHGNGIGLFSTEGDTIFTNFAIFSNQGIGEQQHEAR